MLRVLAIPYIVAAGAYLPDQVFTWGAVAAGIFLVLNQFGLIPKGKTFERVRQERDELERELMRTEANLTNVQMELEHQKERPDLTEIAKLMIDHDRRIMSISTGITETLLAIAAVILP